ncbi:unnamed protein product [Coregonus sp. 'balchen']|nr:unnamed protein product [Coregonus sp. 'balchen']
MDPSEYCRFSYEPFNISISVQEMSGFIEEFIHFYMHKIDHLKYLQDMMAYGYWLDIDTYYSEIRAKPSTYCEMIGQADLWLIRTYQDFGYPHPFLPNFKFVGGILCKPVKPLPEDIEEFVQSSGDDGILVFILGSMIKNLTTEKWNMITSALGQNPQKVLWRLSREKPETLAPQHQSSIGTPRTTC